MHSTEYEISTKYNIKATLDEIKTSRFPLLTQEMLTLPGIILGRWNGLTRCQTLEIAFLATLGFLIKPHPKYGTYLYTLLTNIKKKDKRVTKGSGICGSREKRHKGVEKGDKAFSEPTRRNPKRFVRRGRTHQQGPNPPTKRPLPKVIWSPQSRDATKTRPCICT